MSKKRTAAAAFEQRIYCALVAAAVFYFHIQMILGIEKEFGV